MDALKIVRVRKALGLKRDMVGVRFMPYKKEYDLSEAEERRHIALCEVVSDASRGIHGKTRSGMLSCKAAGYIIGLEEAPSNIRSGLEATAMKNMRATRSPIRFQTSKITSITRFTV